MSFFKVTLYVKKLHDTVHLLFCIYLFCTLLLTFANCAYFKDNLNLHKMVPKFCWYFGTWHLSTYKLHMQKCIMLWLGVCMECDITYKLSSMKPYDKYP